MLIAPVRIFRIFHPRVITVETKGRRGGREAEGGGLLILPVGGEFKITRQSAFGISLDNASAIDNN
jgi:hypothetical protein